MVYWVRHSNTNLSHEEEELDVKKKRRDDRGGALTMRNKISWDNLPKEEKEEKAKSSRSFHCQRSPLSCCLGSLPPLSRRESVTEPRKEGGVRWCVFCGRGVVAMLWGRKGWQEVILKICCPSFWVWMIPREDMQRRNTSRWESDHHMRWEDVVCIFSSHSCLAVAVGTDVECHPAIIQWWIPCHDCCAIERFNHQRN